MSKAWIDSNRKRWYEHKIHTFTENDICKLLGDFNIQTDHAMQATKPDVIFIDKERKNTSDRLWHAV